jgi:transposase
LKEGAGVFRMDIPRVLGDEENELPPSMRTLLADLWTDFKLLEARIEELSRQIQRSVQYSDTARRLMTVPRIGPLAASALEASTGNVHQFANGRFFAVWVGLTPRELFHWRQDSALSMSSNS